MSHDQAGVSAWPFLTGRARVTGHRQIVAPEGIGGPDLASVIGSRVGPGEDDPDVVHLEQFRDGPQPLSAIFRVYRPLKSDFGLEDDAAPENASGLADNLGRRIVVTEGFIVKMAAAECERSGFTIEDLQCAHEAVVTAYQRFWQEEGRYQTTFSDAMPAAGEGTPLNLDGAGEQAASDAAPAASVRFRSALRRILRPDDGADMGRPGG